MLRVALAANLVPLLVELVLNLLDVPRVGCSLQAIGEHVCRRRSSCHCCRARAPCGHKRLKSACHVFEGGRRRLWVASVPLHRRPPTFPHACGRTLHPVEACVSSSVAHSTCMFQWMSGSMCLREVAEMPPARDVQERLEATGEGLLRPRLSHTHTTRERGGEAPIPTRHMDVGATLAITPRLFLLREFLQGQADPSGVARRQQRRGVPRQDHAGSAHSLRHW